jgi:hypothetical protein
MNYVMCCYNFLWVEALTFLCTAQKELALFKHGHEGQHMCRTCPRTSYFSLSDPKGKSEIRGLLQEQDCYSFLEAVGGGESEMAAGSWEGEESYYYICV